MPRTRIVATIGPASEHPDTIREMIRSGMNVARLNFSHGSHAEHLEKMDTIRSISRQLGRPVGILQDLCGPKIRVGTIPPPGILLQPGQPFVLTGDTVDGTAARVSVTYRQLPRDVRPGDCILLADGMMELSVRHVTGDEIHCNVVIGGLLTSQKGINLPTGTIHAPSLTEKDLDDLQFGLAQHVDFIALSFVRSAEDILRVKQIVREHGRNTPVIAKIEKHEALQEIDAIMAAADAIMVARGDLGVEIPLENVPSIQKMLIRKSNFLGKPVIIATQMLRSMVDSPRPTRAEATDVANGVLDGADAVMLSEESATGKYPVEAIRFMRRIIRSAETGYPHEKYIRMVPKEGISESVGHAACVLADHLQASAIVATTRSGVTASHISRYRPRARIVALSPDEQTVRRLTLLWGCDPFYLDVVGDTDEMIESAAKTALATGKFETGDLAVITAGRPVWAQGTTNMLWVKKL